MQDISYFTDSEKVMGNFTATHYHFNLNLNYEKSICLFTSAKLRIIIYSNKYIRTKNSKKTLKP